MESNKKFNFHSLDCDAREKRIFQNDKKVENLLCAEKKRIKEKVFLF